MTDPGLAAALRASAQRLGVSPLDLATVISYETGGTFNPAIRGGAGNRHIGLIQFGPNEQRAYGANQSQSFVEQLGAVERYVVDRGFKPGMGRLDLYSTVNAGRPGRYNASDAGNGGAPGTVADKVANQMGAHEAKAAAFLGGTFAPVGGAGRSPRAGTDLAAALPGVTLPTFGSGHGQAPQAGAELPAVLPEPIEMPAPTFPLADAFRTMPDAEAARQQRAQAEMMRRRALLSVTAFDRG